MVVSISTVVISIAIGCLAGYGLARYAKAGSFLLLFVALIFRALPRMVFVLPFYYLSQKLGLYDTNIMLILVMVAINQPFTIWMLRSFFMNIPEALEEAAMVDGCTRLEAFRHVCTHMVIIVQMRLYYILCLHIIVFSTSCINSYCAVTLQLQLHNFSC